MKLACALLALAACGQPSVGSFEAFSVEVDPPPSPGVFADTDHTVGQDLCPDDLALLTIIASDDADLTQSILLSVNNGNGIDVIDFDDGVGVATGDLEIVDLLPGDALDVALLFNCANDQDFDVDLTISSDHPDATDLVGTVSVTFN